jgi:anti-sigma factor RsiW
MSCREMRDRVQAYADDELGLEGVLDVEAHLERCAACRETFERQRAFRHMLAALYPRDEPPPELARSVRSGLRGRRSGVTRAAAVAAAAVAVVLVTLLSGRSGDAMPPEVRAALGLHRAAQDGGLALGLVSRDVDDVNRWLHHEVPFVTDVPEAETRGFAIRGAAAVELSGTRAGYVLYEQAGARPISLFVLPRREWPPMGRAIHSGNVEFRWIEEGADRVVAWSHDPVSYLLVSDAARDPSEACGVCHLQAGVIGGGDPPAATTQGGRQS